jgi:hypothetical protein
MTRISLLYLGTEWAGSYLCQVHCNHAPSRVILINFTFDVLGDKECFDLCLHYPLADFSGNIKFVEE